jgi:hypothetical protein
MSYDVVLFEPSTTPRDREGFKQWFERQTDWDDNHNYMDPNSTTPALRNWYEVIRQDYPAMNGPDACEDDDAMDRTGDYNFGPDFIYVTYPWSLAEEIYDRVRATAVQCEVGFYDVSGDDGDGEIYFPGDQLRPPSQGAWRQIAADFQTSDLSKYIAQAEQPKRRWFDIFRRNH